MLTRAARSTIAAAVSTLFLAALVLCGATLRAAEGAYQVDGVHSTVLFKVKHLGVSNSWGRFNSVSGSVDLSGAAPAVEIQVKADTIDTGNEKRDQHLKGPDFFNVRQFPLITFKGKEAKKDADGKWDVKGDLTLHGVTKPITVKVEQVGTGKGQRGEEKAGFEAVFTIKRSDHGMSFMVGPLGDEVKVIVSLEADRK